MTRESKGVSGSVGQRLVLAKEQKATLRELYSSTKRTVDDLPYTEEFEWLYTQFVARTGLTMTRHDVWRALSSQRKAKELIRKER
ncbi:MAG: hypothetical protein LW650_11805 [Planctomycetaceae bacterium]|jgi:hypothetical protein|nr:hypothetical protein [Phycisphaerales bacterium]MCE2654114.1 hypothetical protein [Planctomycetaceae bacterium]